MRQIVASLLISGFLVACNTTNSTSGNQQSVISNSNLTTMSKKETAEAFVQAVTSQDADKVRELAQTDYIQHNPFLPTGLEPFIGLFPLLKENGTSAQAIRGLEDENFVVLHQFWTGATPFGANEMVSFDVFQFDDNGKILAHWDALMPNTAPNPSNRTLTDGETEVTDIEKTDENKAKAAKLFDVIINGGQEEVGAVVMENFHPEYHQHSPTVADGIPAVFEAFGREQWVYHTNHKVIGEGNFVLSISEGTAKGIPSVFYDLLRFEDGKIVEHWDVIQAIPGENLANENTMFGF